MTCIAVLRGYGKKLYIAADRRVTDTYGAFEKLPHPKMKKENGVIIAGTGDVALLTIILKRFKIPKVIENVDLYIHEILYTKIKQLLLSKNYIAPSGDSKIDQYDGLTLVVCVKGRLFTIDIEKQMQIVECSIPFATGSGGTYALGSLLTTPSMEFTTKERLKLALTVASQVSNGCDDNIDILVED